MHEIFISDLVAPSPPPAYYYPSRANMDRAFLVMLGTIVVLFGFAAAQTCDDNDVQELQRLIRRVQTCIASVCRVAQNESACECCTRIQNDQNRTPAETSCCEEFTTTNSLYQQCKDRLMGNTGKNLDPGFLLETANLAIQLGLEGCKIINQFLGNAGASVQALPILGLLIISVGSLGTFFL